jgi:hypothetical protein
LQLVWRYSMTKGDDTVANSIQSPERLNDLNV